SQLAMRYLDVNWRNAGNKRGSTNELHDAGRDRAGPVVRLVEEWLQAVKRKRCGWNQNRKVRDYLQNRGIPIESHRLLRSREVESGCQSALRKQQMPAGHRND